MTLKFSPASQLNQNAWELFLQSRKHGYLGVCAVLRAQSFRETSVNILGLRFSRRKNRNGLKRRREKNIWANLESYRWSRRQYEWDWSVRFPVAGLQTRLSSIMPEKVDQWLIYDHLYCSLWLPPPNPPYTWYFWGKRNWIYIFSFPNRKGFGLYFLNYR